MDIFNKYILTLDNQNLGHLLKRYFATHHQSNRLLSKEIKIELLNKTLTDERLASLNDYNLLFLARDITFTQKESREFKKIIFNYCTALITRAERVEEILFAERVLHNLNKALFKNKVELAKKILVNVHYDLSDETYFSLTDEEFDFTGDVVLTRTFYSPAFRQYIISEGLIPVFIFKAYMEYKKRVCHKHKYLTLSTLYKNDFAALCALAFSKKYLLDNSLEMTKDEVHNYFIETIKQNKHAYITFDQMLRFIRIGYTAEKFDADVIYSVTDDVINSYYYLYQNNTLAMSKRTLACLFASLSTCYIINNIGLGLFAQKDLYQTNDYRDYLIIDLLHMEKDATRRYSYRALLRTKIMERAFIHCLKSNNPEAAFDFIDSLDGGFPEHLKYFYKVYIKYQEFSYPLSEILLNNYNFKELLNTYSVSVINGSIDFKENHDTYNALRVLITHYLIFHPEDLDNVVTDNLLTIMDAGYSDNLEQLAWLSRVDSLTENKTPYDLADELGNNYPENVVKKKIDNYLLHNKTISFPIDELLLDYEYYPVELLKSFYLKNPQKNYLLLSVLLTVKSSIDKDELVKIYNDSLPDKEIVPIENNIIYPPRYFYNILTIVMYINESKTYYPALFHLLINSESAMIRTIAVQALGNIDVEQYISDEKLFKALEEARDYEFNPKILAQIDACLELKGK